MRSVACLAAPATREAAARELAEAFGAEAFLIFVRDPEIGALLSAPGFPQTLPNGRLWRAFLAQCVERGRHEGTLPLRSRDERLPSVGYAEGADVAFALVGTQAPDVDVGWLRELLPLLGAVFQGERAAAAAMMQAAAARESAARAAILTETLDRTRHQLEAALAEARNKSAELELQAEELRRTGEELHEANRRLAMREESIRRHASQFWGLTEASLAINSIASLDDMLRVITEKAREVVGAHQAVTSMTANMNGPQAVSAVSHSEKYTSHQPHDAPPQGSSIYAMVSEMNRPVRLTQEELERHPRWAGFGNEAGQRLRTRGWLAAPLVARSGENLGLIQLWDKYEGDFTEADEAILVQLAHMASVAVENARLFAEAQAARAEAEAANRAKGEFLAMMSHELRTPLNAIGGYAELLEIGVPGSVTEKQRDYIRRIRDNGNHLRGLIDNVLNFAKLEAGRVEFRIEDVPLAAALTGIGALVEPEVRKKQLSFENRHGDSGIVVRADREKVRQVLVNLLSNAVKATDPGGQIVLAWEAEEREVCIRVTDTGVGIPPEKLEAIFEPFVQVEQGPSRRKDGTGLGLAISRDLARGMGGDLTVTSVPGEGSTFTLRLPLVSTPR